MLYVLGDLGVSSASANGFALEWRIVLAAAIWVGGLWKPPVAYALFVAAMAYPLYLVSIYVMALGLAVLILSAPAVVRFLPQALWVLFAPLFAPLSLLPLTPLLAGLWWGEAAGAMVGALAALWLKIGAAMAGASPGLWQINGWTLTMEPIYARFHGANSLQTLLRIIEPLSSEDLPGSLMLLLHLLQVLSWTAAGFAVGFLTRHLPVRRGKTSALALGPGVILIWAGYVAVPTWLGHEGPSWFDPRWLPAQVVLVGAVAWVVDALGRYLRQPLLARPARQEKGPARLFARRQQSVPPKAQMRKKDKSHDDQDIIMLELD